MADKLPRNHVEKTPNASVRPFRSRYPAAPTLVEAARNNQQPRLVERV